MERGDGHINGARDRQDLGGAKLIRAITERVTIGVYGKPFITLVAFD